EELADDARRGRSRTGWSAARMADRAVQIALPALVLTAAFAVVGLIGLSLGALVSTGEWSLRAGDLRILGFTLLQAALSAILSVALAMPLARALFRRSFPGRAFLMRAFAVPFLLPVIVAVVALSAMWGRQGPVSDLLVALGLPRFSLFGLQGILIAHVFLNLPLALRMLLAGWARIPSEYSRLSASLRLSAWQRFVHVELPMLKRVAPQALAAVFLICLTSFVVILTLGGGPKNTTLELGIYQALRFDFQPSRAVMLSLLQLSVGLSAAIAALWIGTNTGGSGLDRPPVVSHKNRMVDGLVIGVAGMFLLLPLALLLPGLSGLRDLPASFAMGTFRAAMIGIGSGVLTLALALPLAIWTATERPGARIVEGIGLAPLAVSPLVLGTGLYLILSRQIAVTDYALILAAIITGVLLIPFFLRMVTPALRDSHQRFDLLSQTLRLGLGRTLLTIHLPRARREIAEATGLCAALACGEMSVLSLLAGPDQASLPMQVHGLLGAYRVDLALSAALLLVALSVTLYTAISALGGRRAA
ncbi:MAG: ABC transporter permease subunit, partial [Deltaproteobacteria bacterium]